MIWATSSHNHVCIHKQDLHLSQQGISNQSRARQVQFGRNKSITHDLALTSREWKAVLLKLIQVSQNSQNKLPTFIFQSNLSQAILNARGWKLVMLYLATRPSLCQKTIRSLKHSFQSCTALPGFSQSAKWAVPKARSVRQAIPPGSFQSISRIVQAILSGLDHFKYELLNEKPH